MIGKNEVDVSRLAGGVIDAAEQCQEIFGSVPGHAVADDYVRLHVERGEQRGCAVAPVVEGHE